MEDAVKTVAVLTDNPALSAILSSVLAGQLSLRVRSFESVYALQTYMRIVPVDLLVCDFEIEGQSAAEFLPDLRDTAEIENPLFQVIALTRAISAGTRSICMRTGIEEIIVKPMSPRHIEERVLALLSRETHAHTAGGYAGLRHSRPAPAANDRRQEQLSSNVVPLFPLGPNPHVQAH